MIWCCIVSNFTLTENFTDTFGQCIKNIFSFSLWGSMLINYTPEDNNSNKITVFEGESFFYLVLLSTAKIIFLSMVHARNMSVEH